MYNIGAGGFLKIVRLIIFFVFQTQLRRENEEFKQRVVYYRGKVQNNKAKIETLKTVVERLQDEKLVLRVQNEAACDAKSVLEEGVLDGKPWLEIVQDTHDKLREVTPDLNEEDLEDEEALPIVKLPQIEQKDMGTQT